MGLQRVFLVYRLFNRSTHILMAVIADGSFHAVLRRLVAGDPSGSGQSGLQTNTQDGPGPLAAPFVLPRTDHM